MEHKEYCNILPRGNYFVSSPGSSRWIRYEGRWFEPVYWAHMDYSEEYQAPYFINHPLVKWEELTSQDLANLVTTMITGRIYVLKSYD